MANPNNTAPGDMSGRAIDAAGLGGPNSPAEQLAGALQDGTAAPDGADAASAARLGTANPLPAGVPPVVVLAPK